jgi:hypothetical protein
MRISAKFQSDLPSSYGNSENQFLYFYFYQKIYSALKSLIMKHIHSLLFIMLMCCGWLPLSSQTCSLVSRSDTLAGGDVILTITNLGGTIIDKGLARPGFGFANDTLQIDCTQAAPPDNTVDVFTDLIDMPGTDGGFLPQDVLYNPHNGKYYIYGFRKVMVCNADLQPEQTIDICDVDNFLAFYSDYQQPMIAVNSTNNEVYCLTMLGELLALDALHNKTQLVPPMESGVVQGASLMYCSADASILYFMVVANPNGSIKTVLNKYSLTDAVQNMATANEIVGYDLDYIPMDNHYKVFLATNQGIRMYNDDLSGLTVVAPTKTFDHLAAMNQYLFAHEKDAGSLGVYNAGGGYLYQITNTFSQLRFMLADVSNDRLYTAGYTPTGSGVNIVGKSHGNYSLLSTIVAGNPYGLTQNPTQVLACGATDVLYIDKNTLNYTTQASTLMGQMYRIAANTAVGNVCVVQPINGNALTFAPAQDKVLDIGGQVSATCRKGDKIYVAVHKYNQRGYILELNASSAKVIRKIQPAFDFNPVDMFCGDSPEIDNPNIYVAYVDMDDPDAMLKMMYFDVNRYTITNTTVALVGDELDHLITPNQTIVLGCLTGTCAQDVFYFYDYSLNLKASPYLFDGCIHDFIYLSKGNTHYIAQVDYCGSQIRFFSDQGATCTEVNTTTLTHAQAAAYNASSQLLYCVNSNNIGTIDPWNGFTLQTESFNFPETVHTMFYNPNDHFVYVVTTNLLMRFAGINVQPVVYNLPQPFTDKTQLDDVELDIDNNRFFLVSTGSGDPWVTTHIMMFDFMNDPEVIATGAYYRAYAFDDVFKKYQGKGQRLSFYPGKENLFCADFITSNALFATTHAETRTLTGNWNWISFPCLPRLNNDAYGSQALLQNLDPFPDYFKLITSVIGENYSLTYVSPVWYTDEIPTLISTQGNKYYSSSSVVQNLPVHGTVLDPNTPIPLNAAYENWIGYFLEYPLDPQDAFAGVWNKLTRISTEHWTLILKDGVIVQGPSLDSPIRYGDGVIVTVKENCTLVWNNDASPGTPVDHPPTDYYTYTKKADYVPFYFEMDSTDGIQEIALMVADSCVGAAVVRPGDSITEVNAYLAGTPSGEPITVETWSGYKSARLGNNDYSVVDRITGKRASRTIYTGERQPYYVISFKAGESARHDAAMMLQPPSPNPFSHSVMCSFVLNEASNVTLSVYDMRGQRIATLMQGSYSEGFYEAAWNGVSLGGKTAPDGIYLIRLTANDQMIANEKVVLIR